ncbi:GNAT family N-acetyltransferase [Phototrophicus methaneseepsis]|uniref:GNAT family N-acetyltransferase n=1 Tax=Phototrophicus methaneseepsis TaxID=2710758 RepID=A0A7S8E588_9CHLR|nr:GNAT family N-acetyltransferase [Phototrophicus methaneseepsis]QPC80628.1 GNAT family N-acetyltransferase [Phototrophicus methaneseepsis]
MTAHEPEQPSLPIEKFSVELPITIRQATRDDIKKLEWQGQYTHFRRVFYRAYTQQRTGLRHLLVAVYQDYPIGRLFLLFNSHNLHMANGIDRGYLYSFRVMDLFQGLGIGTRLIHRAEDILRQQNYTKATIAVAKTNTGALRLYQRLGYETFMDDKGEWGYYDHRGHLQQVKEPCWLLEKSLKSR